MQPCDFKQWIDTGLISEHKRWYDPTKSIYTYRHQMEQAREETVRKRTKMEWNVRIK